MTREQVIQGNKKNVITMQSPKGYGNAYITKRDFKKGEVVMFGFGRIIDHQTSHFSVQMDIEKHFLPEKWTGKYWNHSCDANTYMNTRNDGFPNLLARRNIKKGEEVTYSFWESEFKWESYADENHIQCKCGSQKCKHKIFSFSQLPVAEKSSVIKNKLCAKYISRVFEQSKSMDYNVKAIAL